MDDELLQKLKQLQCVRSDISPFMDHLEFQQWADDVTPLLYFDTKLQKQFKDCVRAANISKSLNSADGVNSNIGRACGIVNQAVTLREIMPVKNPAQNPAPKNSECKVKFLSLPNGSALTRIAFEVVALVVSMSALLLIRQHLGIPL